MEERKKDKEEKVKEEKVKDIEFPKPPKPFEPDGKIHKVDPKNPFKPTMKQIKEVFQNRIDEEQPIDENMFTGFLGLNSQAYIIYYIMEQQKQIDKLTQQLESLPEGKQLLQVEEQQKTIDALMVHLTALTKQVNLLTQNKRL